ncbi:MAG: hypothetical protein JNL79_23140 [Myxococcales bacterium]|nr:hypothetical protein [Myxococcales bacterium]
MRQVEDALARQVLYGGDVVTNLLEVAPPPATDEAALTQALAESLEIGAAALDSLRSPDPGAVARVPRPLAEQHGLVPIALSGTILRVALAEPLTAEALAGLEKELGLKIEQRAASLARLSQALERAYGVVMDRRTRRLVSMLDGSKPTMPSTPPPRRSLIPDLPDDPVRPATVVPKVEVVVPVAKAAVAPEPGSPAVAQSSAASVTGAPATTVRDAQQGAQWFVKPRRPRSSQRMPAARRRRGPFTRKEAEAVFAEGASTEAVLGAVLDFAQQYFAAVALFLVHEELAEGFDARGSVITDRVRKMGVPLDIPSQLAEARKSGNAIVRTRSREGLDGVIATDLDRSDVEGDVLVAPMRVGKRVVALLSADDEGEPITLAELDDLLAVLSGGGTALARIIVRRKRKESGGADVALPLPTPPPPPVKDPAPKPSFAARAQALARALTGGKVPNKVTGRPPAWAPALPDGEAVPPVEAKPAVQPASLAPIVSPIPETPSPAPAVVEETPTRPIEPRAVPVANVFASRRTQPLGSLITRSTNPGLGAAVAAATEAAQAETAKASPSSPPAGATPASGTPTIGGAEAGPARPPSSPNGPAQKPSGPRLALAEPEDDGALSELEAGGSPSLQLPREGGAEEAEPTPLVHVPQRRPIQPDNLPPPQPPPPSLRGRRPLGPVIPREEPEIRFSGSPPYPGSPVTTEPDFIEAGDVSDDELEELLALAGRESERLEVYQPRQPPRPAGRVPESELPKVMVALEPEHVGLVAKLVRGGEGSDAAAAELEKLGVAALAALMDRFPGPTRCDRTAPIAEIPAPADAGPLLRVLSGLGRVALRDILARVGDPTPETRFWAVWLLTEIVDVESAAPLVPRLVDDDLAVRRAAGLAARVLVRTIPQAGEYLIEPLVGVVLDPGGGVALRVRAAQALGEVRDKRAAEGLVLGLEAREGEIIQACHDALVIVTRHDPTSHQVTWPRWLHEHGQKSRIEWLIDALLDEDAALREAAGHELKELTKQYFGYYANLPRSEREQAYKRYLAWWESEGRAAFAQ